MGRNMFDPDRGEWDLDWTGWWGPEPPYHAPVFVLAHQPRDPLILDGTTFEFVTDGIEAALGRAAAVAVDKGGVACAGGAHTVGQCLLPVSSTSCACTSFPVTLGRGDSLFEGDPSD